MKKLSNHQARHLLLDATGLAQAPTLAPECSSLVTRLGLLQLDTVKNVVRAHDHVLWSRSRAYREPMLYQEYVRDRALFEHFTHDASILSVDMYPYWRRHIVRMQRKLKGKRWVQGMSNANERKKIVGRIREEGPLSTRSFKSARRRKANWSRPPHKMALDYLWLTGRLGVSHRQNFEKFYDLIERVVPPKLSEQRLSDAEQVHWLCSRALSRLQLAFSGDIARFWNAVTLQEAKRWLDASAGEVQPLAVDDALGATVMAACPASSDPNREIRTSSQIRLINPFDPLVRDRKRLQRVFGFNYRNEMFVPAKQRIYGYYVYPLLERDRFVGRVELKADRARASLNVIGFWSEPGIKWSAARRKRLHAELDRFRRFAGLDHCDWLVSEHPSGG